MDKLQQLTDMVKDTDFIFSIDLKTYTKPNIHVDVNWLLEQPFVRERDRQWTISKTASGRYVSVTTEFNGCVIQALLGSEEYLTFSKLISEVDG